MHPLSLFFQSKGFTDAQGMDWLQGVAPEKHGRLVSDNCVKPEDVCAADTDNVLRIAKAHRFIPVERRTADDIAAIG
jgi:hypothetical protein